MAMKDALVMIPVDPVLVAAFTAGMDDDKAAAMEDPDQIPLALNLYRFADETGGHGVTISFKCDHAVPGYMTRGPVFNGIGRLPLMGDQQVLFFRKHVRGFPMGCAMRPLVSTIGNPAQEHGV